MAHESARSTPATRCRNEGLAAAHRPTVTAPRVLDRVSHHWSTWVPADACSKAHDVQEFYLRCGVTLAALHVLAGTDVHCENLIASGPHPVVVDLELLLNPGPDSTADALSRTGMLPDWRTAPSGHRFDMSALGADSEQHPDIANPSWRDVNTDQMRRVTAVADGPELDCRVRFADSWPTALEHLNDVRRGFAIGYRGFLDGREELLADPDIRSALTGLELRVLLRDSVTYARLLAYLLQPDFLRDGVDRSIEIEWLARPLSVRLQFPAPRLSVYAIEREALEAQDVPHITTSVWRAIGADEDEDLEPAGAGRSAETVYRRLASLSEEDLRARLALVENAIRGRFASTP